MTMDRLSEQEAAQLRECENDIRVSFWVQVDRMVTIQQERLYRADYATFSDWLLERFPQLTHNGKGISESTFRQWKASWQAYNLARTQGVELSNENAARVLRQSHEALRVLIINKAVEKQTMLTGEKPEVLTAAMISASAKIVTRIIETASRTGCVDVGDGSMVAFEAAIDLEAQESILRQQQHIMDSAKKRGGWSAPVTVYSLGLVEQYFVHNVPEPEDGYELEIRWRYVRQEQGVWNG